METYYNNLVELSKTQSISELTSIVEKLIPIGFSSAIWMAFKPDGFFRARKHNHLLGSTAPEGKIKIFLHEGEFWNKPAEYVDDIGRCNDIKESVLYCSTDKATAIIESKPTLNEYVSVSSFELRDSNIFPGSRVRWIGTKYLSQIPNIRHMFTQDYRDLAEKFAEIDIFLDNLFHVDVNDDNKHLYKLSNAVTRCMMKNLYDGKNQQELHGMMYSSIERDKKNFNLIYRPRHARYHFVHHEVQTYEVIAETKYEIILKHKRKGLRTEQKHNSFDNDDIIWFSGTDKIHAVPKNVHK